MKIDVNGIEIEVIGDVESVVVKDKKVVITPKPYNYTVNIPYWYYEPWSHQGPTYIPPQTTWTITSSSGGTVSSGNIDKTSK